MVWLKHQRLARKLGKHEKTFVNVVPIVVKMLEAVTNLEEKLSKPDIEINQ